MNKVFDYLMNDFLRPRKPKLNDARADRMMAIATRSIADNQKRLKQKNVELKKLKAEHEQYIAKNNKPSAVLQNKLVLVYDNRNLAQERVDSYTKVLNEVNEFKAQQGMEKGKTWVRAYVRADGTIVKGFYRNTK